LGVSEESSVESLRARFVPELLLFHRSAFHSENSPPTGAHESLAIYPCTLPIDSMPQILLVETCLQSSKPVDPEISTVEEGRLQWYLWTRPTARRTAPSSVASDEETMIPLLGQQKPTPLPKRLSVSLCFRSHGCELEQGRPNRQPSRRNKSPVLLRSRNKSRSETNVRVRSRSMTTRFAASYSRLHEP
jgi:hypothetical protein